MAQVIINGDRVSTERDLHDAFARQLEFGDFYGYNLAALRDRLSTDVPRPVEVVWKNSAASRQNLGPRLFDDVVAVLREVLRRRTVTSDGATVSSRSDWNDSPHRHRRA